jgi:DNA repair exonuclease SbcCD ATPase subunit
MILHSWKHAGTVAFPREVSIDFDVLPDVIGIYGRNGSGKTTFLDTILAAFYLQMPFRPDPLHAQFASRGFIEVQWSIAPGGQRYISRVNVDPAAARTEASLFKAEGGPAIAGPLQKNYLAEIVRLLGSLDLFLCTAYTVQPSYTTGKNAFSFLLAERNERRGIFAELLGTGRYGMDQAACRDRGRAVETKLAGSQALAKQWEGDLLKRPAAALRQKDVAQRLDQARTALATAQEAHQGAVTAVQAAREAKLTLTPYREQRDVLMAELYRLRTRWVEGDKTLSRAEVALQAAREAADAPILREAMVNEVAGMVPLEAALVPLENEILALELELGDVVARIGADQPILAAAAAIDAAHDELTRVDQAIEEKEAEATRHMNEDSETLSTYRDWILSRNNLRHHTTIRDQTLEAIAIVDTVPCGGTEAFAGCRFLTNAAAAKRELPKWDAEVTKLEQIVGEDREEPVPCAPPVWAHVAQLKGQRLRLVDLAGQVHDLETARDRADDLATRRENLGRKLDDRRTQRREITEQVTKLPALRDALKFIEPRVVVARSLDAHSATAEAMRASLASLTDEGKRKEAQLRDVQAMLANYDAVERALGEGDVAVMRAAGAVRAAQSLVTGVEKEAHVAEQAELIFEEAARRLEAVQREIGPLQEDLDDWTLLIKAFGPAGIATLLVDQALPEISTLATDLLRDCLGETVFTIQLLTQRASADDKKLLEVLDVVIYRDGKKIDVKDLSGGEGVLVSEALSLAIALYNARRTGSRPYTLFRDEVGANLDEERAPAYTRLLARALQVGGFKRVLFVSHHQRALAIADARVHIIDGVPCPE